MLQRHATGRVRPRLAGRRGTTETEGGFTLVELLVALVLITLVMASLTTFFIGGLRASNGLRQRQVAVALADQGIDRASALTRTGLVAGRDSTSVGTQWSSASTVGVDVSDTNQVSDPAAAAGTGSTALLPTTPQLQTVNDVDYATHFFVGTCYQPVGGGDCDDVAPAGRYATFYRVAVAVRWTGASGCATNCAYVTTTLISADSDSSFNVLAA